MRYILAHYLKDAYIIENIAERDTDSSISVDKSLFIHENGVQVWGCGMINNSTRTIRLELLENRSQNTMKKIIKKLIPKGNKIITDNAN